MGTHWRHLANTTEPLEGTAYHSPKLHPGPCSSVGMRRGTYTHGRDHYTVRVVYDWHVLNQASTSSVRRSFRYYRRSRRRCSLFAQLHGVDHRFSSCACYRSIPRASRRMMPVSASGGSDCSCCSADVVLCSVDCCDAPISFVPAECRPSREHRARPASEARSAAFGVARWCTGWSSCQSELKLSFVDRTSWFWPWL